MGVHCEIVEENHFLLESLAAWHEPPYKLIMHFAVNLAFVNFFDHCTISSDTPLLLNLTMHEQLFPISLQDLLLDQIY